MARGLVGLLLALLVPGSAPAQGPGTGGEAPDHRLAVEVGGVWQGVDEIMATPLRYTGTGLMLGLAYQRRWSEWRWSVRGAGALPRLHSPVQAPDAGYAESSWFVGTSRLMRRLARRSGRYALWAGPGLAGEVARRRHTYTTGSQLNFYGGLLALQVAGRVDVELGRYGHLSEALALPVAALAVRNEYAGVVGRPPRTTLGLPPSVFLAHHRLVYHLPADGAVRAYVVHESSLVRQDDSLGLASVSHRLGVAVEWVLGRSP